MCVGHWTHSEKYICGLKVLSSWKVMVCWLIAEFLRPALFDMTLGLEMTQCERKKHPIAFDEQTSFSEKLQVHQRCIIWIKRNWVVCTWFPLQTQWNNGRWNLKSHDDIFSCCVLCSVIHGKIQLHLMWFVTNHINTVIYSLCYRLSVCLMLSRGSHVMT